MRTGTIDPHAENYYHLSPYSWCGNNPINAIDPNGMDYTVELDTIECNSKYFSKVQILNCNSCNKFLLIYMAQPYYFAAYRILYDLPKKMTYNDIKEMGDYYLCPKLPYKKDEYIKVVYPYK